MPTLSQVTAAVGYLPSLNLQYIYCFIASLFGGVCTTDATAIEVPSVDGVGEVASTTIDAAAQTGGSFWSWLWPFGGGSSGDGGGATEVIQATTTVVQDPSFWSGVAPTGTTLAVLDAVGSFFSFLWTAFSWLSYSVSGILFIAVIGAAVGLILIRIKEWTDFGTLPPRPSGKSYGWSRWQDLLDAAMTAEPKRWREAIIAADGMLGELLTRLGYHGETTAIQLSAVPEGAFVTQSQAWEAHRIRNFVAKKNSNFILTQREAFRVLKLYEQVFEEFDFI